MIGQEAQTLPAVITCHINLCLCPTWFQDWCILISWLPGCLFKGSMWQIWVTSYAALSLLELCVRTPRLCTWNAHYIRTSRGESLFCLRYSGCLNLKKNPSFLQEQWQKFCSYHGIMSNAFCWEEIIHGHWIIIEFGCLMLHAFKVLHDSNGMSLTTSWIPIDSTGENVARYFGVPIECSSQDRWMWGLWDWIKQVQSTEELVFGCHSSAYRSCTVLPSWHHCTSLLIKASGHLRWGLRTLSTAKNGDTGINICQDGLLTSCADYSFDLRRLEGYQRYNMLTSAEAERCNDFIPSSSSMTLRRWVSWLEAIRIDQLILEPSYKMLRFILQSFTALYH